MRMFAQYSTAEMRPKYMGMLQTTWDSPERFMRSFKGTEKPDQIDKSGECFKQLTNVWNK